MPPKAMLAIRSDIAPSVEPEYLEWLTKEHTIERLSIDGFLSARIFRAQHTAFGRYWILYELSGAAVVDSPAYLERLNNPTRWTARMMPHLENFVRGGGKIIETLGNGYGAALVPILIQAEASSVGPGDLQTLLCASRVAAIRMLQTDRGRTETRSNERVLRTGDQSFAKLLMIEALDTEAAMMAAQQLHSNRQSNLAERRAELHEDPAFSLIFHLNG